MKLAIQIVGVMGMIVLAGLLNACNNQSKHDKCVDMGGKFVLNTTQASRSMCILEN
jgi:hypothetical protein